MIKKDTIALIPARSGSKGLPNKNIRMFLNRPLLYWSLKIASDCESILGTYISTDSDEYLNLARKLGALDFGLRKKELALDDTPMSKVILDFVLTLKKHNLQESVEYLILLDPTSPLRKTDEIEASIDILRKNKNFDGILSISKPHFNPAWVSVVKNSNESISRWNPQGRFFISRQQTPPIYRMNGLFYVWRIEKLEYLMVDPWLERGNHTYFETSEVTGYSIDTELDFKMAELIVKSGLVDLKVFNEN